MLIGSVFSSIRRYQYLKDENILLKKIDSLLQLNSTNFIISNTDSLHNCNLADKFHCEEFMKTNEKKIVLRNKNNLLIMSKDKLTLLDPNSFKKQYSFDLNLGNISQGLIFENDTVISYSQNNLHKIQILPPSYENLTLINRKNDQLIIQMSNGLLVAVDDMNYICVFDPKKNYETVNKFEHDEKLSFELIELPNGNQIRMNVFFCSTYLFINKRKSEISILLESFNEVFLPIQNKIEKYFFRVNIFHCLISFQS